MTFYEQLNRRVTHPKRVEVTDDYVALQGQRRIKSELWHCSIGLRMALCFTRTEPVAARLHAFGSF